MKKKILFLLMALVMVFSLCACNGGAQDPSAEPSMPQLSDEETIDYLLEKYEGLNYPAVSYDLSASFSVEEQEIRMTGQVAVKNESLSLKTTTAVGETSVDYRCVYVDGMLYVDALGVKMKSPATADQAGSVLENQQFFDLEDTDIFRDRTLLRSEDGSFLVVLSLPSEDVLSLLNLSSVLSAEEGEEIRFTKTSDFYVSLAFSPEGNFQKMTVGGTVTVTDNGVETSLEMEVVTRILSVDPAEITVTAPEDADLYLLVENETPSTDSEGADGTTSDGAL